MKSALEPRRQAWMIALGFALFRIWYVSRIQLSADEAYYWEWSRNLALSYYDQGPMLALAIRLGTTLFGPTELGVRFISVLCAFLGSGIMAELCAHLKRPNLAPWLVLVMNSMLLFSVGAVLMMHDSLMGFFWILGLAAALKAVQDHEPRWWLGFGLAAAAAILSKYTGILLLPCLLLALGSHPSLRSQTREPLLWLAPLSARPGAQPDPHLERRKRLALLRPRFLACRRRSLSPKFLDVSGIPGIPSRPGHASSFHLGAGFLVAGTLWSRIARHFRTPRWKPMAPLVFRRARFSIFLFFESSDPSGRELAGSGLPGWTSPLCLRSRFGRPSGALGFGTSLGLYFAQLRPSGLALFAD